MIRIIITTGNTYDDGTPETLRVVSRHRTQEAAERALQALRRRSPVLALKAVIVTQ